MALFGEDEVVPLPAARPPAPLEDCDVFDARSERQIRLAHQDQSRERLGRGLLKCRVWPYVQLHNFARVAVIRSRLIFEPGFKNATNRINGVVKRFFTRLAL